MKKFIFLLTAFAMFAGSNAFAKDLTGKKIYVNPGHGGYDPTNDRNVPTIPFAAGDHNGFYESKCNLVKGLELRDLLEAAGATVMMSRTQNRDEDDKVLTEISAEANAFGADGFISVHSNALSANAGNNYLLTLYKGNENAAEDVPWKPEDKVMATRCIPFCSENNVSVWNATPKIKDDYHFLGFYLGVMRLLTVPGFLVESSFHDYEPETHRLLNNDYAKMTAVNLYRFYLDYYGADAPTTGEILGSVKDSQRKMSAPEFNNFIKNSHDQYQPLNGATVTLMDASGNTLDTYITDDWYNGIYVFRNLAPGNYKVRMEMDGYITQEKDVTVQAAKTTSFYTLLEDPTYEPPVIVTASPNIYASELSAGENGEGHYTLSFTLNSDATDVQVIVYNETGDPIVINAGALPRGRNSVLVRISDVKGNAVKWEVKATGEANTNTFPAISSNPTIQPLGFNQSKGIAVDNSMESEYFGRVYVTESLGGSGGGRTTTDGLYVLDATLSDVTGQGDNSYTGNVEWATQSSASPMRVSIAEDGSIYINDWSDAHPGIWKANPADLNGTFTPIFGGTLNNAGLLSYNGVNIAGSISACWVKGTGENTILYTIDEDYVGAQGTTLNLLQYNIGNADSPWSQAPSAVVFDNPYAGEYPLLRNANCVIVPDKKGGWWISQYRWTDSPGCPSLIYVKNGQTLFNSGAVDPALISTSQMGAMALSYDGSMIAVGAGDETRVFNVSYNGDVPSITPLYVIVHGMTGNSFGLAFDYANNLYLANGGGDGVAEFALPTADNSRTTVAPKSQYLKGAAGVYGDVNGDGVVSSVDVTAIYNYLLNGDTTFLSTSDVDGDGVVTSVDITIIYNILLGN
ncbi:MAG: N-acetylmuramoyl-L-alanine amidase [Muribaculaceae bacterium]|nr:N-acetylmuramoyl-L-alanine amidase [Muribaculaceae bacterium]MBR6489742.1 N-acetylmuramoyl-L-alanine amidase [Muribaculaceae bacterium]